jgi:hypothetical protein
MIGVAGIGKKRRQRPGSRRGESEMRGLKGGWRLKQHTRVTRGEELENRGTTPTVPVARASGARARLVAMKGQMLLLLYLKIIN